MANDYGVRDEKAQALEAKLKDLGVSKTELIERFVRSRGPGGQHVNRSATAVYLKHLPSGIEVKAQQGRSQALNRFFARRTLAEKLEAALRGADSALEKRIEKKRRQKERRRRRSRSKSPRSDTR